MSKRKSAVFTIVKNESFFLPFWLDHYKKHFESEDIYILDHSSSDGSIALAQKQNPDINIIPVKNEKVFDHNWLLQTVINAQSELLTDYECVLFAEADEFIYSLTGLKNSINDFIESENQYSTCIGYDIIQAPSENSFLDMFWLYGEDIFEHRQFWTPNPSHYNKTLLSKLPLDWCMGFHTIGEKPSNYTGLYLAHLHRVDFDTMYKRNIRAISWNFANENPLLGEQNKTFDIVKLINYFNNHGPLERIPEEHKKAIKI